MKDRRIVIDARCLTTHMHGIARVALRFIENAVQLAPENEYIVLIGQHSGSTAFPRAECLQEECCNARLYGIAERFVIPRLLKRLAPDLYYSPTYFAPSRACCPVVFTIHDLIYLSAPGSGNMAHRLYFDTVVKRAAANAARVVTDSRFVAGQLAARLRIPPEKIATIHPGVDNAFGTECGRPPVEGPYILNISNPFPHKNTAALLAAYGIFLEKGGSGYKLVIAGRQDNSVRKIAASERLRRHVELAGEVDDASLVRLMRGASLFVLPSRYEGFGLPVLEAMKAGVPVIAGDNTAMAEMYRGAACLVNPEDPQALAEAIGRLLNSDAERRDMTARGIELAKNFTWEKMTREILATFEEVLEGVQRRPPAKHE